MKKIVIISTILLIVGFFVGVEVTTRLLGIELDILSVPYSNSPVITDKDVTIEQGDIKITIPAGAIITYSHLTMDVPYYSINISGWPYEEYPFSETNEDDYFFIKKQEN